MTKPVFSSMVHGWLVLDKPLGLTSTQALGRARRLLGGKKVGHGGTLDPLATGILPLAFGEATKLIPYVMDGDKEYAFTVHWGERRSTDDAEGEVVEVSDVRPSEAQIRAVLPEFVGTILQKPPSFSAIKVQGERAYDKARAGEVVDLPPREVVIHALTLEAVEGSDTARFRVSCGKGMYVRSLARDLAVRLGTCGYVSALRRTKVGPFGLENSVSMPDLECLSAENGVSSVLLPLKTGLESVLVLNLSKNEAHTLLSGQQVVIKPCHGAVYNEKAIFTECDGVPIALVEPKAGMLRVVRGFHF